MNKNYTVKRFFELLVILSLCSGCKNESSQVIPVADKTQPGSSSSPNPAPSVAPYVSPTGNKEKEEQNQQKIDKDFSSEKTLKFN